MKQKIQKWSAFAGKSMLWSLLLYVAMTLALNWDDIHTSMLPGTTAGVTHHTSTVNKVMTLINSFTKAAVTY